MVVRGYVVYIAVPISVLLSSTLIRHTTRFQLKDLKPFRGQLIKLVAARLDFLDPVQSISILTDPIGLLTYAQLLKSTGGYHSTS